MVGSFIHYIYLLVKQLYTMLFILGIGVLILTLILVHLATSISVEARLGGAGKDEKRHVLEMNQFVNPSICWKTIGKP